MVQILLPILFAVEILFAAAHALLTLAGVGVVGLHVLALMIPPPPDTPARGFGGCGLSTIAIIFVVGAAAMAAIDKGLTAAGCDLWGDRADGHLRNVYDDSGRVLYVEPIPDGVRGALAPRVELGAAGFVAVLAVLTQIRLRSRKPTPEPEHVDTSASTTTAPVEAKGGTASRSPGKLSCLVLGILTFVYIPVVVLPALGHALSAERTHYLLVDIDEAHGGKMVLGSWFASILAILGPVAIFLGWQRIPQATRDRVVASRRFIPVTVGIGGLLGVLVAFTECSWRNVDAEERAWALAMDTLGGGLAGAILGLPVAFVARSLIRSEKSPPRQG